jgi:hypothetical protein
MKLTTLILSLGLLALASAAIDCKTCTENHDFCMSVRS